MENRTVEEVCQLPKPEDVIFPEKRSYVGHQRMCNKMRGRVTVVKSDPMMDRLIDVFKATLPNHYSEECT